jgi:hypothetical protein
MNHWRRASLFFETGSDVWPRLASNSRSSWHSLLMLRSQARSPCPTLLSCKFRFHFFPFCHHLQVYLVSLSSGSSSVKWVYCNLLHIEAGIKIDQLLAQSAFTLG